MAITSFRDSHRFLSNFWPADVELDGDWYKSVEHAYQAAKTLDIEARMKIRLAARPGIAKQMGRTIKEHGLQRPDWQDVMLVVMEDLLRRKFHPLRQPALVAQLKATADHELIEGNTWGDTFYGCVWLRGNWVGENHLGKLLMKIRSELV